MKKVLYSLFLMICFQFDSIETYAQDSTCPTRVNLVWMQANDQARYQRFQALEDFTANYINSGRLINNNGIIVIPVVVHVLHRGEPEGTGYNISMAIIQAQIDLLNKDFRRLNPDANNTPTPFLPVASDMGIEFRLACIDPEGNPTNGIIRKYTSQSEFYMAENEDGSFNDVATGIKTNNTGSAAWPTDRYLNIWVCNLRFVDGYGTWPADYEDFPLLVGVVVRTGCFGGLSQNSGRVLAHEIGKQDGRCNFSNYKY